MNTTKPSLDLSRRDFLKRTLITGGGLAFLGEESGERISHVRAKELAATGASIVGAACPFCNTMFRDALAATSDAPPQLLDIAQITAQSIANATATPSNGAQNA